MPGITLQLGNMSEKWYVIYHTYIYSKFIVCKINFNKIIAIFLTRQVYLYCAGKSKTKRNKNIHANQK